MKDAAARIPPPAPAPGTAGAAGFAARHPVVAHVLVALASLGLVSLAFHPADLWGLGWVAFVPWMAWHAARPRAGTARALMAGYYLHFAAVLAWTAEITWFGPVMIPLLGLPFVALLGRICDVGVHRLGLRPLWVYPLAIVTTELLRDRFLGLTWSSVGYSQWRWLEGVQSASVFRVHGLSFAVLTANAALAEGILHVSGRPPGRSRRRAALGLAWAAALLLAVHAGGALALRAGAYEDGPMAVGVQGNIPQRVKGARRWIDIWAKHVRIYLEGGGPAADPDLVVFPETSFAPVGPAPPELPLGASLRLPAFSEVTGPLATLGGVFPRGRGQVTVLGYLKRLPIPPGSDDPDDDGDGKNEWNVAGVLRDGEALLGETEKRIIVPFGEYVPWPDGWPFRERLKKLIRETGGFIPDLEAGTSRPITEVRTPRGVFRFGIHICYEAVFPEENRDRVRRGADFVVNISNDAWFNESSELDLVHVAARFRAVEVRRSLLRVSNSGISTLIDPSGRYLDTVEAGGRRKSVEGVVRGRIPVSRTRTPVLRWGDLPCLVFPAVLAGLLVLGAIRRRRGMESGA